MIVNWEKVTDNEYRKQVFGGWLYLIQEAVFHDQDFNGQRIGLDQLPALTFIPDPNYEWVV